jgi:hypothetical protein
LSTPDPAKKLSALLKKLRAATTGAVRDTALDECPADADRLLWQLIFSFLAWEASVAKAGPATKRLHACVVDYNEMRVALTDELAGMIGERYPRAEERAARLRSSLNDLYKREHKVSLARVAELPKRDARALLDALEGMPSYVSGRMMLLSLGGHAFPLDERMHKALEEEGAVPADTSVDEASGWLERQFRAGEAAEAYLLIENWMNDRPLPKPPKRPARRIPELARAKTEPAEDRSGRKGALATRPAKPRKPVKE